MADVIIAVVLLLGGTSAAEWVRWSCRRRLATPILARRPAQTRDTNLRLQQ